MIAMPGIKHLAVRNQPDDFFQLVNILAPLLEILRSFLN
jgi:hypothetical protein